MKSFTFALALLLCAGTSARVFAQESRTLDSFEREQLDNCKRLNPKAHPRGLRDCTAVLVKNQVELPQPGKKGSSVDLMGVVFFPVIALGDGVATLALGTTWLVSGRGGREAIVASRLANEIKSSPDIVKSLGADGDAIIADVSKRMAKEALEKSDGGAPDRSDLIAPVTLMISHAIVMNSLGKMDLKKDEKVKIANSALESMNDCFFRAEQERKVSKRQLELSNCVSKFSAAAPYWVARSVLEHTLQSKLADKLSADDLEVVLDHAGSNLTRCMADRQKPEDTTEIRIALAEKCSLFAASASFKKMAVLSIEGTLKKMSTPTPEKPKPAFQPISDLEQHALALEIYTEFEKSPPLQDFPKKGCNFEKSMLSGMDKPSRQTALFEKLKPCSMAQFTHQLQSWQNDLMVVAGRTLVKEAVSGHPLIPVGLKENGLLKPVYVEEVLQVGYEPCIRRQVERYPSQLAKVNPELCLEAVELGAKLVIARNSVKQEFQTRLSEAGLDLKIIDTLHSSAQKTFESCAPKLVLEVFDRPTSKEDPFTGLMYKRSATTCIRRVLEPYLSALAEASVIKQLSTHPDLAPLLPANREVLVAQLRESGILKKARELTVDCLLEKLDDYYIDNLQRILAVRQGLCVPRIAQKLSVEVAKLIAHGLVNTKLPPEATELRASLLSELNYKALTYDTQHIAPRDDEFTIARRYEFELKRPPYDTPEIESSHIALLEKRSEKFQQEELNLYRVGQRSLKRDFMGLTTKAVLASELAKVFPTSSKSYYTSSNLEERENGRHQEEILKALSPKVEADIAALEKEHDRLARLEAAYVAETNPTKKKEVESEVLSLREDVGRLENEYEARVRYLATREIMAVKLRKSFDQYVPELASEHLSTVLASFDRCVRAKREAASLKRQILSSPQVLSSIKPLIRSTLSALDQRTRFSSSFDGPAVDDCRIDAVADATWLTVRSLVDTSLAKQLPDDFASVEGTRYAGRCPSAKDNSDSLDSRYKAFLCEERVLRECIVDPKEDNARGPAGGEGRVQYCLSDSILKIAAPFAEFVLDQEFRKNLMIESPLSADASAEDVAVHRAGEKIFSQAKMSQKFNACVAGIEQNLNDGKLKRDSTLIQAHMDACVSLRILQIAREAGGFASMQYAALQDADSAASSTTNLSAFQKCLADLRSSISSSDSQSALFDGLLKAKLNAKQVEEKVSKCTSVFSKQVQRAVMNGFQAGAKRKTDLVNGRFSGQADRSLAHHRIESGFRAMVQTLEAAQGGGAKQSQALKPPHQIDKQLKLIDKLVTDACLFDSQYSTRIQALEDTLRKESKAGPVGESRFKELLVDSELFESVILGNIQGQLREIVTKNLAPLIKPAGAKHAAETIEYLTGESFLNNRFRRFNAVDRNFQPISGGRSILDSIKADLRKQIMSPGGSVDPDDPAFKKRVEDQVKNYLLNDWEFIAGIFHALSGQTTKDEGVGFLGWMAGWKTEHDLDWMNRVVRTATGCKILNMVQEQLKNAMAGKPVSLDEAVVTSAFTSAAKEARAENFVDPRSCLGDPKYKWVPPKPVDVPVRDTLRGH